MMNLSLKATRFLIEALVHFQQYQDRQLQAGELPEDEISDLVNDRQYLEAIKEDLVRHRDELMQQRDGVAADA